MMSYSSYSSSLTLLPKKPITLHCLITSTWKHLSDLGIDHANGTTLLKTSKCNINSSILNKARRCLESAMLQNSTLYWPATGSFPSFSPLFRIFVSAFPTIHISQKENNPGMRRSSSAKSTGWFPRHNYVLYNIHRGVFLFLFFFARYISSGKCLAKSRYLARCPLGLLRLSILRHKCHSKRTRYFELCHESVFQYGQDLPVGWDRYKSQLGEGGALEDSSVNGLKQ